MILIIIIYLKIKKKFRDFNIKKFLYFFILIIIKLKKTKNLSFLKQYFIKKC